VAEYSSAAIHQLISRAIRQHDPGQHETRHEQRKQQQELDQLRGVQRVTSESANSPLAPKDLCNAMTIPKSLELLFRVVLGPS
jgi:hypothetical protein